MDASERTVDPNRENGTESHDDAAATLDFVKVLLELRNDFVAFRVEVSRDLRAIRASTNFVAKQFKNLGTRVTLLESDSAQIEADVIALASGTPQPVDYDGSGDDEKRTEASWPKQAGQQ